MSRRLAAIALCGAAVLAAAAALPDRANESPLASLWSGESHARATRAVIPRARVLRAGATTTYIDRVVERDSTLRRWLPRVGRPVRVWIAPGAGTPNWQPRYAGLVRQAFGEWAHAGVPVRFVFVRDPAAAEVRVRWVERLPEKNAGHIRWHADGAGWVRGAEIALAMRGGDGRVLGEHGVRSIALHEIGHLLGLEHSGDSTDVMAPWVKVRNLSARDSATVRLLYSLPAGRVSSGD